MNAAADGLGLARPAEEWFIGTSDGTPASWSRPRTRRRLGAPSPRARGDASRTLDARHRAALRPRPGGRPAGRARPTRGAPSGTATRSPTSSAGTSTTPTSATSGAASARSRRASWPRTCAGPPTCSGATRSSAAATRRGTRGGTEVCLQGGIHPGFTGEWYIELVEAIRAELPDLHIHAFSPLEVWQGAYTAEHAAARLPRAAARRRARLAARHGGRDPRRRGAPHALPRQGVDGAVARGDAHGALRSASAPPRRSCSATSSSPCTRRDHLLALRDLARETGGFTEFVPLPFVHAEAPIGLKRPHPPRADVRGVGRAARRGAAAARPAHPEHPGVVGQARPGGRRRAARRRRERPRRHAHERVDLARGRRQPRPGVPAGADGGSDPRAPAGSRCSGRRCTAGRPRRSARAASAPRRSSRRRRRRTTTPASSGRRSCTGPGLAAR